MMETSLTRFGMILDSIQSDVMQVNKGMKEFLMESKFHSSSARNRKHPLLFCVVV